MGFSTLSTNSNPLVAAMNATKPRADGLDVLWELTAKISGDAALNDPAATQAYREASIYRGLLNAANLVDLTKKAAGATCQTKVAIAAAVTIWLKGCASSKHNRTVKDILTSLISDGLYKSTLTDGLDQRVSRAWAKVLKGLYEEVNVNPSIKGVTFLFNGTTLKIGNNGAVKVTTLFDTLQVIDRVVLLDNGAIAGSNISKLNKAIKVARCVTKVEGGVALTGLRSNTKHYLPLMVSGADLLPALGIWAEVKEGATDKNSLERKALQQALLTAGFMPTANTEAAAKHGYLQKVDSLLDKNSNQNRLARAEFDVDGNLVGVVTPDNAEKALTRIAKQYGKTDAFQTKCRVLVISVDGRQANVKQTKVGKQLIASAMAGTGGWNQFGWNRYGVVRIVGFDILGQKSVVGRLKHVVHPNLLSGTGVQQVLGANKYEALLVLPLTAIKSKLAKQSLTWQTDKVKGGEIQYAIVDDVDVAITDFYSAHLFETVPVEARGRDAVIDSLERSQGSRTLSVSELLQQRLTAAQWGSVADVLKELEAAGKVRRKPLTGKLNLQMLQSLAADFGNRFVRNFLKAVKRAPYAKAGQVDLELVYQLITGSIDRTEVNTLDLKDVIDMIGTGMREAGAVNDDFSQFQDLGVAQSLLLSLLGEDKTWTELVGPGGVTVLIPSGKKLARGIDPQTEMGSKVELSGYTADILRAMWVAANACARKDISAVTDNHLQVTMAKLVEARDSILGKGLANIRGFGVNGPLLSSWALKYNQVSSPALARSAADAEEYYGEKVTPVYGKSPMVMANAGAALDLVDTLDFSDNDEILMGGAMYLSAYFIVGRQDDVDGDRGTGKNVPDRIIPNAMRKSDPLDPTTNPTWKASKDFLEGEADSCFFVPDQPVAKLITVPELIVAHNNQLKAKDNVGLFTSFQQVVHANIDHAVDGVVNALVTGDVMTQTSKALSGMLTTLASLKATRRCIDRAVAIKLAQQFVRFVVIPTMGGAMQSDAMDRIKREVGVVLYQLSVILSPSAAARAYVPKTKQEIAKSAEILLKANRLKEGEVTEQNVLNKTNTARTDMQKICIKLMGDYGFDASHIPVVVKLGKEFGIDANDTKALNGFAMCLICAAVSEVGFHSFGKVELFSTLFGNENKIAKAGGNLDTILDNDDLVYGYNTEAMLLEIFGKKGR